MSHQSTLFPPSPFEADGRTETVSVDTETREGSRTFRLASTAEQREDGPSSRVIVQRADAPAIHSGNPLFDALFAEALDDAALNSVEAIRDGAYNNGEAIPCSCFQAGEKWTYVWTRDVAYAIDLGLALVDPKRAMNTLLFKVSDFRDGAPMPDDLPPGSLQIVQDTGSGGSWPVSTDRVSWALGAEALLASLDENDRPAFAATTLRALRGTLEADRLAVYDPDDGLYRGEQSFLDWRDQTYAPWVTDDLTELATSKALSTNVCHFRALRLAARLAAITGDTAIADRYAAWADALKAAINDRFWIEERGLYASITTPDSPALPVGKFDMLGLALAIVSGIADEERARTVLSRYPHAPFGPPVYYPAQPDVRVYHNRALWPFVTAYELMAAVQAGHVAAADHAFDALVRAAALYLNNAENLEWLTGRTFFDDGPQISSARQLWSIGGYVGMALKTVFGFRPEAAGLAIAPFLTTHMRATLGGETAELRNLVHRGRRFTIVLHLPSASPVQGVFPVSEIRLNDRPVAGPIPDDQLGEDNRVDVRFGASVADGSRIARLPAVPLASHDASAVFSPREPAITDLVVTGGKVRLNFAGQAPRSGQIDDLVFTIERDGGIVARDIADGVWFDPLPLVPGVARLYRVVAAFGTGGNASHPSLPAVIDEGAVTTIGLGGPNVERRGSTIIVGGLAVAAAGRYRLDLSYVNHHFHIQTGVTNAVKRLRVFDEAGRQLASGIVQMPHMTPVNPLRRSTPLRLELAAGLYRLEISDFFNMSYLAANRTYISPGGASGPLNQADIRAVNLTRIA